MSNVEDRIAALESRLEELETEREILRTLHQLAHAFDYGPDEDRFDCYTDDAVAIRSPQRLLDRIPPNRIEGREAIDEHLMQHPSAPQEFFKHLILDPKITLLSDSEATVQSYMCLLFHRDGSPYTASFGRYVDRMAACPDGRWRIKERITEIEVADLPATGLGSR